MNKICMVVHQDYYADARVQRYAESLVVAGAQVDVLCVRGTAQPQPRNNLRVFTVPIVRGYKHRASYLLEYGAALALFSIRLLALFIKNRYQLIHVHNMPDFLIFCALLPKLIGAKLILDIHDPMPEFYMSKYDAPPTSLAVRWMRIQEKLSSNFAHAIVTANANFKKQLISRGVPADKITVINNVADGNLFNRGRYAQERRNPRKHFTLIYPGTIAPRYGLDVAIHALPLLVTKIPNIRLLIMGPQVAYVDELIRLAQRLQVASYVEFRGPVPLNDVPRHIAQADIGIYMARSDPHMRIATPSKVLEFASMGIPIVASRLPVLQDLFPESALMFYPVGNVEEFARCILALHANPARREELVENTDQAFVHTHSWRHEEAVYFDLLNQLLGAKSEALVYRKQL